MEIARDALYNDFSLLLSQASFLVGPLFFLYLLSIVKTGFTFGKGYWFHFIPFIAVVAYAVTLILSDMARNVWIYPGRSFITAAVALHILIYLIAGWRIIRQNGLNFKSFLSYNDNSRISLIRYIYIGFIICWTAQLQLFVGYDILHHPQWCPYGMSLYVASAFIFLTGVLYMALNKPKAFYVNQKYSSSQLTQSDKELYSGKIISIMKEDKLFLNSEILLSDIADKLGVPPYYVSQIINESFRQNFRDFVNKFRVEESKRLLTQPNQQLNMLGIALDAGFNSKSSFNNAFKRHTGITPKEFKKRAVCSASMN